MLPTGSDNGARLAAVLPTALASVRASIAPPAEAAELGKIGVSPARQFVVIVVDGLGWSNLRARRGHARTLAALPGSKIRTVNPSTTGAALTSITTGELPGTHGLVGYRIRHPEHGLVTTLNDWDGITDVRSWQHAQTVFEMAVEQGIHTTVIGRPTHEDGGLTRAILTGAEFLGGQRIEDRFALAQKVLRLGQPSLIYLYMDELDRAGHKEGCESDAWTRRIEQLDDALHTFLAQLPEQVGVCLTADHGMVDVHPEHHILLEDAALFEGVEEIGGEPRMRYLYLEEGADPSEVAERLRGREQNRAWVATRDEAIARGMFGPVSADIRDRIGDVLLCARKRIAYYLPDDSPASRTMIGQHGSFTDEETLVPLLFAGAAHPDRFLEAIRTRAK